MEASPCDVHCVNDVVPSAQWANITSLQALASNIIVSEANNITFAIAKTSPTEKREDITDRPFCSLFSAYIGGWA